MWTEAGPSDVAPAVVQLTNDSPNGGAGLGDQDLGLLVDFRWPSGQHLRVDRHALSALHPDEADLSFAALTLRHQRSLAFR